MADVRKGIIVIIVNSKNKVLMLKHRKNNLWGFISGGIEQGESLIEACIRETKEEAGIDVEKENIVSTNQSITFVSSRGPGEQEAFLVYNDFEDIIIDEQEISEYKWVESGEVENLLEPKPPLKELYKDIKNLNLLSFPE